MSFVGDIIQSIIEYRPKSKSMPFHSVPQGPGCGLTDETAESPNSKELPCTTLSNSIFSDNTLTIFYTMAMSKWFSGSLLSIIYQLTGSPLVP